MPEGPHTGFIGEPIEGQVRLSFVTSAAADKEVATIETDKVHFLRSQTLYSRLYSYTSIDSVSVHAPQSRTIAKLLANEEDTVTVGKDLSVLEPGESAACTSRRSGSGR